MERALQERYEEMRVLLDISQLFLKQTSVAETQQAMCEIAAKHFGADVSWVRGTKFGWENDTDCCVWGSSNGNHTCYNF